MAKLCFTYATMGSGKSSLLLQSEFNHRERGLRCLLLTPATDTRYGQGKIASRLGISAPAEIFGPDDNLLEKFLRPAHEDGIACVLIDEIQFATSEQIWQLAKGVDLFDLPVMVYGLRTDFRGIPFDASATLMGIADELRELHTVCHCGCKATMVARKSADGRYLREGAQVQIGGNDAYVPLCRKHWLDALGLMDCSQDAPLKVRTA